MAAPTPPKKKEFDRGDQKEKSKMSQGQNEAQPKREGQATPMDQNGSRGGNREKMGQGESKEKIGQGESKEKTTQQGQGQIQGQSKEQTQTKEKMGQGQTGTQCHRVCTTRRGQIPNDQLHRQLTAHLHRTVRTCLRHILSSWSGPLDQFGDEPCARSVGVFGGAVLEHKSGVRSVRIGRLGAEHRVPRLGAPDRGGQRLAREHR